MSQNQNQNQDREQKQDQEQKQEQDKNQDQTPSEQLLDVRKIDGPPFGDIMGALASVSADNQLRLIAGFEPKPLYEVLEARGFTYETECREQADDGKDGEWHVLIETA